MELPWETWNHIFSFTTPSHTETLCNASTVYQQLHSLFLLKAVSKIWRRIIDEIANTAIESNDARFLLYYAMLFKNKCILNYIHGRLTRQMKSFDRIYICGITIGPSGFEEIHAWWTLAVDNVDFDLFKFLCSYDKIISPRPLSCIEHIVSLGLIDFFTHIIKKKMWAPSACGISFIRTKAIVKDQADFLMYFLNLNNIKDPNIKESLVFALSYKAKSCFKKLTKFYEHSLSQDEHKLLKSLFNSFLRPKVPQQEKRAAIKMMIEDPVILNILRESNVLDYLLQKVIDSKCPNIARLLINQPFLDPFSHNGAAFFLARIVSPKFYYKFMDSIKKITPTDFCWKQYEYGGYIPPNATPPIINCGVHAVARFVTPRGDRDVYEGVQSDAFGIDQQWLQSNVIAKTWALALGLGPPIYWDTQLKGTRRRVHVMNNIVSKTIIGVRDWDCEKDGLQYPVIFNLVCERKA